MNGNLLSLITFLPMVAAVILALFLRGDDAASRSAAKCYLILLGPLVPAPSTTS